MESCLTQLNIEVLATAIKNGPHCYPSSQKCCSLLLPSPPAATLFNFLGAMPLSSIKLHFVRAYLSPLLNSMP